MSYKNVTSISPTRQVYFEIKKFTALAAGSWALNIFSRMTDGIIHKYIVVTGIVIHRESELNTTKIKDRFLWKKWLLQSLLIIHLIND